MFVYNSAVNKARSVKQGDMVSWNSSGGKARGKVIRVVREGTLSIPDSSFQLKGESENPAVLIQLYRDGEPTDRQVGHKMSVLTKSLDVLKHGTHDQKTHGRGGGRTNPGAGSRLSGLMDAARNAEVREKISDISAGVGEQFDEFDDELEEGRENGEVDSQSYNVGQLVKDDLSEATDNLEQAALSGISRFSRQKSLESAADKLDDASRRVRNVKGLTGYSNTFESLADEVDALLRGTQQDA